MGARQRPCILTLEHVHVDRGRRYVLRLTRVIAAVRRVRVRHDQVALGAVDVNDQAPVRVEVDHPVQVVPEHEQGSLRGALQTAHQSQAAAAHYVQVRRAEYFGSGLCRTQKSRPIRRGRVETGVFFYSPPPPNFSLFFFLTVVFTTSPLVQTPTERFTIPRSHRAIQ